jgi:ATP-binding protein involved in chromosome partitioning
MNSPRLTEAKRYDKELRLAWNDGRRDELPGEKLRMECPCAECREARGDTSHAQPLTAKKSALKIITSTKEEQITLKSIWSVGNYALGIEWADGHNSGIYTYELLRTLGEAPKQQTPLT